MKTIAFQPRHPQLQGLIEYFFFNYGTPHQLEMVQTSYANTNICLGVLQAAQLEFSTQGVHKFSSQTGLHSYLTGLYLSPHRVKVTTTFSEICINFTPLGYYHFFNTPLSITAGQNDILRVVFGQKGVNFFQQIFRLTSWVQKLALLETFFLQQLKPQLLPDLQQLIHLISQPALRIFTVAELHKKSGLHTKKLYRLFKNHLGISPKEYLQIHRFRKALKLIENTSHFSLTDIAFQTGYYDQSHFIKEIRSFTGQCPRYLTNDLLNVDDLLLLKVEA